jgi:HAD superfamily hydrolase (TIGR01490 family)
MRTHDEAAAPSAPPAAAGTGGRRLPVALFDLDGTLIDFDSDHAWGEFCCTLGWADAHDYRAANQRFYDDYRAGCLDIEAYLRFALAPLVGRPWRELQQAQARFFDAVVRPRLKPATWQLVERHRRLGHLLAIVTATNSFVTRPIAAAFGIDDLIANEPELHAGAGPQGDAALPAFTGRALGIPSFREGKIARVEQWLQARCGRALADCESWFYSDSINDVALLERVDHPVATNPDARLRALALQRGWPVLEPFVEPVSASNPSQPAGAQTTPSP